MASNHHHVKQRPLYITQKDIGMNEDNQQSPFMTGGTYESTKHFASAQFRLLREKVFRNFRKSIQEYRTNNVESCDIIYLQKGHVYTNGTLHKMHLKFLGEIYTVGIKTNSERRHDFSRYLRPGDVICMSADKFKTFIFAQVTVCESSRYHKQSCQLEIMVDNAYFDSKLKVGCSYHILVTGTCHESHIQSLRKLELLSTYDIPLKEALLYLKNCDKLPPYSPTGKPLRTTCTKSRRCLNEVTNDYMTDFFWLGKKQFDLDEQQAEAFKVALTNQVAVIEGYPGSGKTFLCTALMHFLLTEHKSRLKSPILFLCNTESCLDRQLESMLSYTDNITRIGGPTKRENIQHCKLSNRRKNVNPEQMSESAHCGGDGISKTNRTKSIDSAKGAALANKTDFSRPRTYAKYPQKQLLDSAVRSKGNFSGARALSKSSDSLHTKGGTSNENTEFFNDDKDETNDIDLDSYLSEISKEIIKLRVIAKKILLFPLNDVDIVNQIVPKNFRNTFLAMIKPSEPAESPKLSAEKEIRLRNVVIRWLCLTPEDTDSIKENSEFLKDVLLLYQKKQNFLSDVTFDESHMNSVEVAKYNELLERIFSPDADTFPIIEEAAVRYLSKTNRGETSSQFSPSDTDLYNSGNPWHLSFFQRYQEFSKWRQSARKKVNSKRACLERIFKERVEIIKKDIMTKSVSCSVKSDILGLTFRSAVRYPQFLKKIAPEVVIVDESDAVLEGEIISCLPTTAQHLIFVGERSTWNQPTWGIEDQSSWGIEDQSCIMTLPGRLKKYGAPSWTLRTQHRVRPSINELLFRENNESMEYYPDIINLLNIESVSSDVFFIEHNENMDVDDQGRTLDHSVHEAKFLLCFFNYLSKTIQPGINIRLLVSSTGQMELVNELSKKIGLVSEALQINDFRGEETDIVLLSLANRPNCDPMRIFNDIYTSITRARIGFFGIGNFNLHTKQCSALDSFMQNIRSKGLSGKTLLLRCRDHPEILTSVSSSTDFKKIRSSGCSEKCKK